MPRNVEIKARVADAGAIRELLRTLGASESVESGRRVAVALMGKLHLDEGALLPMAYVDLLEATNVSLGDV